MTHIVGACGEWVDESARLGAGRKPRPCARFPRALARLRQGRTSVAKVSMDLPGNSRASISRRKAPATLRVMSDAA